MQDERVKKITSTAAATAGLLRRVASLVAGLREVVAEIDPEAGDVAADDIPATIGAGINTRLIAIARRVEQLQETVGSHSSLLTSMAETDQTLGAAVNAAGERLSAIETLHNRRLTRPGHWTYKAGTAAASAEFIESASSVNSGLIPLNRQCPLDIRGVITYDLHSYYLAYFDAAGEFISGIRTASSLPVNISIPASAFPPGAAYFCISARAGLSSATYSNGTTLESLAAACASRPALQAVINVITEQMAQITDLAAALSDAMAAADARHARQKSMIVSLYEQHPELIAALPAATIAEYFPDIVAICSPADSVVYFDTKTRVEAAPGGIIRLPQGYETEREDGKAALMLYSTRHVRYLNCRNLYRFAPGNTYWEARLPDIPDGETPYPLECIEQPVNMDSLRSMDWFFEQYSGHPRLASRVSFKGTWDLSNVESMCDMFNLTFREDIQSIFFDQWPDMILNTSAIDANGYVTRPGTDPRPAYEWFMADVRAARYPTIDTGGKGIGNYMFASRLDDLADIAASADDPEQRFIIRNLHSAASWQTWHLHLMHSWHHDDMVTSLATLSRQATRACSIVLHPGAIARLTDEDKAAITAKGYTIASAN